MPVGVASLGSQATSWQMVAFSYSIREGQIQKLAYDLIYRMDEIRQCLIFIVADHMEHKCRPFFVSEPTQLSNTDISRECCLLHISKRNPTFDRIPNISMPFHNALPRFPAIIPQIAPKIALSCSNLSGLFTLLEVGSPDEVPVLKIHC